MFSGRIYRYDAIEISLRFECKRDRFQQLG